MLSGYFQMLPAAAGPAAAICEESRPPMSWRMSEKYQIIFHAKNTPHRLG